MIKKLILVVWVINITLLLLCSHECQSAPLTKDINCFVGDVNLSKTKIRIKLTFDDDKTGSLKITKLGKNKINEFYFVSLEGDTLTLTGEIVYDIRYLAKRQKQNIYIYPINASPDEVIFYDKSLSKIKLVGKKEKKARNLFISKIIDGDFFEQEHSKAQDYNLVIRHCLSHTDESYDETFSDGLSRMLQKYPKKIEGLRKALELLPTKQRKKAYNNMIVYIVSAWIMEQDSDSINPNDFYHTYPFFEKCSMIDKLLMEQMQ